MRGRGPGRRFRRGGLVALALLVVFIAALATVVASAFGGNAPSLALTVPVTLVVFAGLLLTARWLFRSGRTIGALLDAADRVAAGDYAARVPQARTRQLARLTSAFNEMTERLETSEARRRELLADVAHELRTPLQVIRGTLEGVLEGLYPADTAHLRPLVDEIEVMARLLEDLRILSMAEAGVLTLEREATDPRRLAEESLAAFRTLADEGGLTFRFDADGSVPASIDADPVRLSQVLTNLVSNAVRHTPPGGTVTIALAQADGRLAIQVHDTGPGIPAEQLPHIFDRFVRSADTGGSGLGLAIAKRLVEAHGGTIQASAPPGAGTTIRITLPA
jgi:signal transduction histidine kinase